jgi:hypothetical protein
MQAVMIGILSSAWLAASVVGASTGVPAPHAPDAIVGVSSPQPIKNGIDADTCQFPSVVAMLDWSGTPFCTGSLIHPELVLFAAHCDAAYPTAHVAFGESADAPARQVSVQSCERFPGYTNTSESVDLAYCRLAEPVTDIPIVPVMAGCEVEELRVDDTVTIVGFGATDASFGEYGWENVVGGGIKRYTTQTVELLDLANNDIYLLGNDTGGCPGDSGGPVLVELSDGSWRVAGVGSTVHPDAYEQTGEPCGYGTVYDMAYTHLAWIESSSGLDVTPCQTVTGFYDPEPGCGPFPRSPGAIGPSWANACANADAARAPFCSVVDEDPPIVELLVPSGDVDLPDEDSYETAIEAAAHDELAGVAAVWLRINGDDLQPELAQPPYVYPNVTFPVGSYELEAVARDYAGNVGVSPAVVVRVGLAPESDTDEPDPDDPGDPGDPGDGSTSGDPPAGTSGDEPPSASDDDSGGCGCTTSSPPATALLLVLLLARRRVGGLRGDAPC